MKRHQARLLTEKEQRKLWPHNKIFMTDYICTVCGAIKQDTFHKGKNGKWELNGEPTPFCKMKRGEEKLNGRPESLASSQTESKTGEEKMEQEAKPTFQIIQANFKSKELTQTLWEGKADTIQFCQWQDTIARPMWTRYCQHTNKVITCFPHPNNLQFRLDDNGTIWCEPATKKGDIEKLEAENKEVEIPA